MKHAIFYRFPVLVFAIGLVAPACSDDETSCEPGHTRECVGPAACKGGQSCLPDGSGYSACDCSSGATGGMDGGGATGGTSASGGSSGTGGSPATGGSAGTGGTSGTGGSTATGGSGGSAGSAGADGGTCDPVAQTGCPAGQKCTWLADSEESGHTGCAPQGTIPEGAICTASAGAPSYDDCRAGLVCSYTGLCARICDLDEGCGVGYGCFAQTGGFFGERGNAGLCDATCNPLTQNCPDASDACYVSVFSGPAFCGAVAAESLQGQACTINACAKGYGCVLPRSSQDQQRVCAFFCDPTGSAGPSCADGPGAGFECREIKTFYGATSRVAPGIGMCVDPQIFP